MAADLALLSGLDYPDLDQAWEPLLAPLGLGEPAGRSLLIKPNLMLAADPAAATCTHPLFVISLARHLVQRGFRVSVGDSSGALGLTTAGARRIGLIQGLAEAGAAFIDFDRCALRRVELAGGPFGEIALPAPLLEADLRLNAPKLKTHTLMGLSAAVKNAMGCLPGALKPTAHARWGASMPRLAALLAELCRVAGFDGHVLDAIDARQGGGSQRGEARRLGLAAAGRDPVALDALAARLAGWNPERVLTIAAAEAAGLGLAGPGLEFALPPGIAADPPLRPAGRDFKTNPLVGRLAYALRSRTVRPRVLRQPEPEALSACLQSCPWQALHGPLLVIERARCTRCLVCAALCPPGVIGLEVPRLLRPLFARRARGLAPGGLLPDQLSG